MAYRRFAAMIATSTVVMFGLMYLNTYALPHVFFSQTRGWMALVMGAAMAIVMIGFMWGMYKNRAANIGIVVGGVAVFGLDVARDHAERGGEHRGVVGEAQHRHHVRHEIERQDEIGQRAEQRRLHMAGRLPIERAVIGAEQFFGEWQAGCDALELGPEAPANALGIPGEVVRRLKSDRMLRNHGAHAVRETRA